MAKLEPPLFIATDPQKRLARSGLPSSSGWAIFRVILDAAELTQTRGRFEEIWSLINAYKRACCHLAWLRSETRLIDPVPKPWDGRSIKAKTSLRDRLIKGPLHDGAHGRGSCQRPIDDGVSAHAAEDQEALLAAAKQIETGRPA